MIKIVEGGYQIIHAPGASLDHGFDWSNWLSTGETISSSVWTVDTGITQSDASFSDTVTVVYLTGGTAGQTYNATNTITTSLGKEDSRTFILVCMQR